MNNRIRTLAIVAITLMAGLALCQTSSEGSTTGEEPTNATVIVTARRTSSLASQAPANVSVVTGKNLVEKAAVSIPEALSKLQGIHVVDASGVGTSSKVHMRGFTTGMSAHYLVLVDGIPQNSAADKLVDWNQIPLENVARIEVVRGPLSTLYGENAMSGVMNIITEGASADPGTRVYSSIGSYNSSRYGMMTSGLIGNNSYSFTLGRMSTDGYREHCSSEYWHSTGKVNVDLNEDSALTFWAQYGEAQRGAYPWHLTEAQIEEDRNQARPGTENDEGDSRKLRVGTSYARRLSSSAEMNIMVYLRDEDSESFYTSGSSFDSTAEILDNESVYGANLKWTLELPLWDLEHVIVAGLDLERDEYDYDKYSAPSQVRGEQKSDYDSTREMIGLYAEDQLHLSDTFRLLLGGRYSALEYDFTDRMDPTRSNDRSISSMSGRISASYDYRQGSVGTETPTIGSLYANVSRSFRAPTLGQMFTYRSANPDLEPETAIGYELGVRDAWGKVLSGQASLYWIDVDEEIAYDSESRGYLNLGQTRHKGIEVGLEAHLTKALTCFANYTYSDARAESGDDAGKRLPHVAEHMGNAGIGYNPTGKWGVELTASVVASSAMDAENSTSLPGYTTMGLRGWYEVNSIRVFAKVDNILDEDYYSYGYVRSSGNHYSPAPGATFHVGASLQF